MLPLLRWPCYRRCAPNRQANGSFQSVRVAGFNRPSRQNSPAHAVRKAVRRIYAFHVYESETRSTTIRESGHQIPEILNGSRRTLRIQGCLHPWVDTHRGVVGKYLEVWPRVCVRELLKR